MHGSNGIYGITRSMEKTEDPRERHYNTIHSRTRIAVEIAFGWLKNRFQILLRVLNGKSVNTMTDDILSCMVLHNFFLSANDDTGLGKLLKKSVPNPSSSTEWKGDDG